MSNNGKGEITAKMLSDSEKIDVLLDAVSELSEKVDAGNEKKDRIIELQEEIIEKLDNVSRPGTGFSEEELE